MIIDYQIKPIQFSNYRIEVPYINLQHVGERFWYNLIVCFIDLKLLLSRHLHLYLVYNDVEAQVNLYVLNHTKKSLKSHLRDSIDSLIFKI